MADKENKSNNNNNNKFRDSSNDGASRQQINESLRDGINKSNNIQRTQSPPDRDKKK